MTEAPVDALGVLKSRMDTLAARIGAPGHHLPMLGDIPTAESWITYDPATSLYRLSFQDHGHIDIIAESRDPETVLEHAFDAATFSMALEKGVGQTRTGEDPRRALFLIQEALMDDVDPLWAVRLRGRHAEVLDAHPLNEAPAGWTDHLPAARGRVVKNEALAPFTWLRVGGPADVLFLPADEDDLADFAKGLHPSIPITVIGVGSNLLVRDGGVDGVVVRLTRPFAKIETRPAGPSGNPRIFAGAAALDAQVAKAAAEAGITGLEFFSGIPGTIGGASVMNAGCYGSETKDVLVEAYAINRYTGERLTLSNADMKFSYRHSYPGPGYTVLDGLMFTGALFEGRADDPAAISERMEAITARREKSQPIREKTGGSTFANPPGHSSWKLVDGAGWRGKLQGGAKFSELHANFLINTGEATAADLEGLGEAVRADVKQKTGVQLEWEIKRIGRRS